MFAQPPRGCLDSILFVFIKNILINRSFTFGIINYERCQTKAVRRTRQQQRWIRRKQRQEIQVSYKSHYFAWVM